VQVRIAVGGFHPVDDTTDDDHGDNDQSDDDHSDDENDPFRHGASGLLCRRLMLPQYDQIRRAFMVVKVEMALIP
jgi:hypothetical protein